MNEFVEIDGNLIKKDSITCLTKIVMGFMGAFIFNSHEKFEFKLEYDGKYLIFEEYFKINLFSSKHENKIKKDVAYYNISQKRKEILEKISK